MGPVGWPSPRITTLGHLKAQNSSSPLAVQLLPRLLLNHLHCLLQNQTQFVKIWAIASCADLTGQSLVGAVIALLNFSPQLSQPFADFVCAELTRVELVTATVESCEDAFDDSVLLGLALGGAYLAAKAVAVAVIFSHFTALRAAMNKVVYQGYEWNQAQGEEVKDGEGSGRRASGQQFSPPRRRRSSSGSSTATGSRTNRSDSLPSYSAAAVEAGQLYPPTEVPHFTKRRSHTVSHSSSHRPRLVLVPVFAHDSHASPSSSRSSSSSSRNSPTSPYPPFYAFDAPVFSPSGSSSPSRFRSASSGSHASHSQGHSSIPTWHDMPEARMYSTRRLSHGPFAGAAMGRPVHGSLFGVTATTEEPEAYVDMSSTSQPQAESYPPSRKVSMEV